MRVVEPPRRSPENAHVKFLHMALTRKYVPDEEPYWTSRAVAQIAKTSESTVRRIWRDHGIKPHLEIGVDKHRLDWPPAEYDDWDDPDGDIWIYERG